MFTTIEKEELIDLALEKLECFILLTFKDKIVIPEEEDKAFKLNQLAKNICSYFFDYFYFTCCNYPKNYFSEEEKTSILRSLYCSLFYYFYRNLQLCQAERDYIFYLADIERPNPIWSSSNDKVLQAKSIWYEYRFKTEPDIQFLFRRVDYF